MIGFYTGAEVRREVWAGNPEHSALRGKCFRSNDRSKCASGHRAVLAFLVLKSLYKLASSDLRS